MILWPLFPLLLFKWRVYINYIILFISYLIILLINITLYILFKIVLFPFAIIIRFFQYIDIIIKRKWNREIIW